ncbi:MAG: hypothetical protein AAGA48_40955 [Myxococcota bacterium]
MTLFLLVTASTVALAQDNEETDYALDLTQGTVQIGGAATANIAFLDENPDVFLIISPSGGFFASDNTLVRFDLDLLVDEVEGFDAGVSVGLDRFFPGEWIAPYLGVGVGYGTRQLDDAPSPYSFPDLNVLSGTARAGILLPANPSIGVDIGAELNINYGFASGANDQLWVTVPMGYTGVRAFFN